MNCPNCGSQTQAQQQFCRSCGAAISAEAARPSASPLVGIILAFSGILIALTGSMLLHTQIIIFAGVVTSLLGMMLIALIPYMGRGRTRRPVDRTQSQPVELQTAASTMKLPPASARDEIFSVTDNTTELLKTPASNKYATGDFSK